MKPRDTQSFAVRLYNNKDSKNEDGKIWMLEMRMAK